MRRLLAEIGQARGAHPFEIAAERRQGSGRGRGSAPCRDGAFERQRLAALADLCDEACAAGVPAAAPPASSGSRRRRRHGRASTSCPDRAQHGERVDAEMPLETLVLGRRSASGDRAGRHRRPRSAAATCRRRKETRAGSTRRAPAPASTAAGCGRATAAGRRDSQQSAIESHKAIDCPEPARRPSPLTAPGTGVAAAGLPRPALRGSGVG